MILSATVTFLLTFGDCAPSAPEQAWIQGALSRWERASDSLLRLPPTPLPWMVLYDLRCTWNVAPDSTRLVGATRLTTPLRFRGGLVPIYGTPNAGSIRTPPGDSFPIGPRVYAAMTDPLPDPYFVAALPEVFRADPAAARDSLLDERIASVLSHEIVHTRQLPDLRAELRELRGRYRLPAQTDDNVIERELSGNREFTAAFERERDLLYRAAFEPDVARARQDAAKAVALIAKRRARFFTGPRAGWDRMEDAYLNLEGVGEWVRFALHRGDRGRWPSDRAIVDFIRGRQDDWVQDEGLGLYLLIDRLVPNWQRTLTGPRLTSPVELLGTAFNRP